MIELLADIERWSVETPERDAVVCRDARLDYRALWTASDALASLLRDELPRHVPVAVYGHKEPAMAVGFLACLKAGHPYVPIDAGLPPARIDRILAHSRAALVIAPSQRIATELPVRQLAGAELWAAIDARRGERPRTEHAPDDLAYVMYTSGSTGEPKGVQITVANLSGFVAWARAVHPIGTGRRFLNQAPFSFDLSVMDLYLALTSGSTLHCVDRGMIDNPLELRAMLARSGVEIWVSTPSFAELCLADRRFDARALPDLDSFLFCGETLPPACVQQLRARFPAARVYNLYGPTEATVAVTSILVDDAVLASSATLPLGTPMPGVRLTIRDRDGNEVAAGESGEIVIEGPCVSPGYLHAPELTARVFDGPRYRTGDGGHFEGDALIFEGRLDSQIKLSGYRIELDDVARNLEQLPAVERALVLPIEHAGRCEALVAFVIARGDITGAELRRQLAERVPSYMVPRTILCRREFPITVNGKLDRARLAQELAGPLVT